MVQALDHLTQAGLTHPQIAAALLYLSNLCDGANTQDGQGFNKFDSDQGHRLAGWVRQGETLNYEQQRSALTLLRKYKKQLTAAGLALPSSDEFKAHAGQIQKASLVVDRAGEDEFTVTNPIKGTQYEIGVLRMGSGYLLQCDCPLNAMQGKTCKHIEKVVAEYGDELAVNPESEEEYEPEVIEVAGELAICDDWLLEPEAHAEYEQVLEGIELNQGQQKALREMAAWLSSNEQFYLLTGAAGTGKSTVLQALITCLRKYGDRRGIVFSAPTNKAVKVLMRMALRWNLNLTAMTCHKLLGLKPIKHEGTLAFVPDPKQEATFDQYGLVIVDEASMLNESMWYLITDACKLGQKILFVGDEYQAPPVNESLSKVFQDVPLRSTLTEVVRYAGAIGQTVESIRQTVEPFSARLPVVTTQDEGQGCGVFALDKRSWEIQLLRYFKSDDYKLNPDHVRAIAFSNKRVDALALKIREALYGCEVPQFFEGERLIAHTAYSQNEQAILPTSEEMTVLSAQQGTAGKWQCWYLQVRLDDGEIYTVPTLDETEQGRFTEYLAQLKSEKRWHDFWQMREAFAELRYPYAITSHKAQGSTFQNAFIDIGNFTSSFQWIVKGKSSEYQQQKLKERNRLLYTAMSRAAKGLYLLA